MNEHNGPWKEGRICALSLCYIDPAESQLGWVLPNHAGVGIRATLALSAGGDPPPVALERNWDLATLCVDEGVASTASESTPGVEQEASVRVVGAVPGTEPRSYMLTVRAGPALCPTRDGRHREELRAGPLHLSGTIPPPGVEGLLQACHAMLTGGQWIIWCVDRLLLEQLGPESHARLLALLGTHHAAIWCAPVRDIAAWSRMG